MAILQPRASLLIKWVLVFLGFFFRGGSLGVWEVSEHKGQNAY